MRTHAGANRPRYLHINMVLFCDAWILNTKPKKNHRMFMAFPTRIQKTSHTFYTKFQYDRIILKKEIKRCERKQSRPLKPSCWLSVLRARNAENMTYLNFPADFSASNEFPWTWDPFRTLRQLIFNKELIGFLIRWENSSRNSIWRSQMPT